MLLLQGIVVQHLPEQSSPATRRVFLLARDHVAGTHCAVLVPSTLTDPNATLHCIRKAPFIRGILEVCLPLWRIVVFAVTQIFVASEWSNDLSGIHLPIRIPNCFEFAERLHEFLAKHDRQKLAS